MLHVKSDSQIENVGLCLPRSSRGLMLLLSLATDEAALESLASRLDISQVTSRQLYFILHRRLPKSAESVRPMGDPNLRRDFIEAVLSQEFQESLVAHLLHAFPELERDIFIHIPKCAGTDLIASLAPKRLSLGHNLGDRVWTPTGDMLRKLSDTVRLAQNVNRLFLHGHFSISEYASWGSVRPDDHFFTILRDPIAQLLSAANYAVGRLVQDPAGLAPDTREVMDRLQISGLPRDQTPDELAAIAARLLADPQICVPGIMCKFLSMTGRTCQDALSSIIRLDIEVTTTVVYSDWLEARWAIKSDTWLNRAETYLTRQQAMQLHGDYILEATEQDRLLYAVIVDALRARGDSSVRGRELADAPIDLASVSVLAPAHAVPNEQNLVFEVVARGKQASSDVSSYWRDVAEGAANGEQILMNLGFGELGEAHRFALSGFSNPEENYTWTMGRSSEIVLPKPGTYLGGFDLLLHINPFVHQGKLEAQRLTVLINGGRVAVLRVPEHIVLRIPVPSHLVEGHPDLSICFLIPDAARPADVNGSDDDRTIAFCFHRLALIGHPEPVDPLLAERADIPLPELLLLFESLGENCEFGLVQRRCGAEPLGLLRFASAPFDKLVAALRAGFNGLGAAENIEVELSNNGQEYMVADRQFGFYYHAWVLRDEQTPEQVHSRELARVPFLARKLVEDLRSGEKIFVYHSMEPLTLAQALELAANVRRYGPSTVLWVELADGEHPSGSVDWIQGGLLKGYIDRFAPGEDAHDLSLDAWVSLCRNAYELFCKADDAVGLAQMIELEPRPVAGDWG